MRTCRARHRWACDAGVTEASVPLGSASSILVTCAHRQQLLVQLTDATDEQPLVFSRQHA